METEPGRLPAVFNASEWVLDRVIEDDRGDSPALWWGGEPISYATVLTNTCLARPPCCTPSACGLRTAC